MALWLIGIISVWAFLKIAGIIVWILFTFQYFIWAWDEGKIHWFENPEIPDKPSEGDD